MQHLTPVLLGWSGGAVVVVGVAPGYATCTFFLICAFRCPVSLFFSLGGEGGGL